MMITHHKLFCFSPTCPPPTIPSSPSTFTIPIQLVPGKSWGKRVNFSVQIQEKCVRSESKLCIHRFPLAFRAFLGTVPFKGVCRLSEDIWKGCLGAPDTNGDGNAQEKPGERALYLSKCFTVSGYRLLSPLNTHSHPVVPWRKSKPFIPPALTRACQ